MAKFKYKFDSIKKVKNALEKKAKKEVAVIELEIEKMNNKKKEIIEELNRSRSKQVSGTVKISEMQADKNYQSALEEQIKMVDREIAKLEEEKEKKLEELIQKSKEHKMFETLEDIHRENYNIAENRSEMKNYDEIATQKFVRKNNER